jgi:myo-inositol-1-phosphate synthase
MGAVLDGVAPHMADHPEHRTFMVADAPEPDFAEVVRALREAGADVLMNYLPVGSQKATEFYAECALEAGVAFVNNIPVFIASDPEWAARFQKAGVPIIGDDIKAQVGATIVHRTLVDLFRKRGVRLDRTYQLNTGPCSGACLCTSNCDSRSRTALTAQASPSTSSGAPSSRRTAASAALSKPRLPSSASTRRGK